MMQNGFNSGIFKTSCRRTSVGEHVPAEMVLPPPPPNIYPCLRDNIYPSIGHLPHVVNA